MSRAVEPFLHKLAVAGRVSAPWRWELSVRRPRTGTLRGEARREGDWLVLELAAPARTALAAPQELLRRNARLDGVGKLLLAAGARRPRLRAELPVETLAERLAGGMAGARAGFDQALAALAGAGAPLAGAAKSPDPEGAARALAEAAEESGWSVRWDADGVGAVEVGSADAPRRAVLAVHGAGFRAGVELAGAEGCGAAGRQAQALLLLAASAAVRLVRAVESGSAEERRVGFEVSDSSPATAAAVDRALSALSLATRLVARETRGLSDRPLAETYLASLGWTP